MKSKNIWLRIPLAPTSRWTKSGLIATALLLTAYFLLPSLLGEGLGVRCFSQTWLWAKSASGSRLCAAGLSTIDEGLSVSTDAVGNVFVTGFFEKPTITFGSATLINATTNCNYDMFIAKYDACGNVLWAKRAGGIWLDAGFSVSADAGGNVFVTGMFSSSIIIFGSTTLTHTGATGNGDVFIAKYDPNGNVLWAKSAGGTSNDDGSSVSVDTGGNVFVTGRFEGSITFGSTTLSNAGRGSRDDIFIAKYDANGTMLWAKSAGGSGYDYSGTSSADIGGNLFVTGMFGSPAITFGTTTLINAGIYNVFIAKYDANGNVLWAQCAGGTGIDAGFSVSADPGGNVYVTGYFKSPTITFGTTTLISAGGYDVFIAKYDASGNVLWAQSAGGTSDDAGYSVSADAGGNVFVTGGFFSSDITFGSTTLTPPIGSRAPMFIVKYDAVGNVLCASAIASGGDDKISVSAGPYNLSGNAYIEGDFDVNPFIVGSDTLTLTGAEDIFVAKYTCGSGSNILTAGVTHTNVLCNGQCTGTGTIIPAGGSPSYSYLWNPTAATTATSTGLCAGNYTVMINDAACGTITATVTITQPTAITVTINSTPAPNGTATVNPSGGIPPYTYLWNTAPPQTTQTATGLGAGVYCCLITDANNCTDTACVTVTIEPIDCSNAGELYLPNAFSPNNDGENDVLKIYYGNILCIKTFKLVIYNRWGEKVFETSDPAFRWDGIYRGKLENTAVFVYYMKATLLSGEEIIKKGNISLIR